MNKLDLAEALITIADTGSIYQAAGKLHQTSAAISKKLTKLETLLETQLVLRDRKGLVLTEAGQRYYHEAKKALAQFALAESSVLSATTLPSGELKVVANQYYAQNIILPKLPEFMAQYPAIEFNLEAADILPDFNAKKMHILFGVSAPADEQLVRKRIAVTRYVLCASPAYLKQKGIPSSTVELLQHDYIAHSGRKKCEVIMLDREKQVVMKPTLFVNNSQLMITAALENLGFIWAHENMVSDLLAKKKLIPFLEAYTQQPTNVYAYYEYQTYSDPKIKAFMHYFD